jgi:polysaccharide pyruvyl transferase WcaK-like protein
MHVKNLEVQSLEHLSQIYVNTLVELYSKDEKFSFVLIPHEMGDEIVLAEAILKALPVKMQPNCIKIPTPCRAAEVKSICRKLDIVLTGRMHVSIACLGQGTPVACITYQGKFEGLFRHFELDGMTIEPSQAFLPGNLVKFLMPLIEKREDISKHIQLKQPEIQQLAEVNFS